ncbi:hypothetical protein CAMGR0001_1573 [Campylobacter gracilis RM3268]|uniref:Uncharacterized protein n=1 Tax=Campylobacter gracilis RM3268 TaxID=553220 RepID=C8PK22_9BACT|nr:hypothetical protein CAMGR0001_1573 [Campylobacter gracilis RM3268]
MSSQARGRLGFCAEFCERNFKCQTRAGFAPNFYIDLARNLTKFRGPKSDQSDQSKPGAINSPKLEGKIYCYRSFRKKFIAAEVRS